MQWRAGPEWDHIDQPTLEVVEKSWAHSRCREVEFDISSTPITVSVYVCVRACVRACVCLGVYVCVLSVNATPHKTLLLGMVSV